MSWYRAAKPLIEILSLDLTIMNIYEYILWMLLVTRDFYMAKICRLIEWFFIVFSYWCYGAY